MFEHFTFGAQPQMRPEEISPSPKDTSFPSLISAPPPQAYPFPEWQSPDELRDIVHQLAEQSLVPDDESPQQSRWHTADEALPSPDFGDDPSSGYVPDNMSFVSTTRGLVRISAFRSHHSEPSTPTLPDPRVGTVACRRLRRQLNVQLQSCHSHLRDINSLVEDMIVTNTQCRLHKSTPQSNPEPTRSSWAEAPEVVVEPAEYDETMPEDEGFVDVDDADWNEMSLRRAAIPSGIRKYHIIQWRGSAECESNVNNVGKPKIRSVPRMRRRRKAPTVRE